MDGSFTIQISSDLVKKLLDDGEKVKKKTRKPKPKVSPELPQSPYPKQPHDGSRTLEWPKQPPFYQPPQKSASPERDVSRSVNVYEDINNALEEKLEWLKRQEENMLEEVTRRAKDLHDKEFKLPKGGPVPCVDQKNACLECYKEHVKDPLKCSQLVKDFADCARTVRQQVSTNTS
ncbi:hypothetical protein ACS0TY_001311 [Phlomoides rotata]